VIFPPLVFPGYTVGLLSICGIEVERKFCSHMMPNSTKLKRYELFEPNCKFLFRVLTNFGPKFGHFELTNFGPKFGLFELTHFGPKFGLFELTHFGPKFGHF
jgi:hypothetical protein